MLLQADHTALVLFTPARLCTACSAFDTRMNICDQSKGGHSLGVEEKRQRRRRRRLALMRDEFIEGKSESQ